MRPAVGALIIGVAVLSAATARAQLRAIGRNSSGELACAEISPSSCSACPGAEAECVTLSGATYCVDPDRKALCCMSNADCPTTSLGTATCSDAVADLPGGYGICRYGGLECYADLASCIRFMDMEQSTFVEGDCDGDDIRNRLDACPCVTAPGTADGCLADASVPDGSVLDASMTDASTDSAVPIDTSTPMDSDPTRDLTFRGVGGCVCDAAAAPAPGDLVLTGFVALLLVRRQRRAA